MVQHSKVSISTMLINALGGMPKAWNYEAEQLLWKHVCNANNPLIDYTII